VQLLENFWIIGELLMPQSERAAVLKEMVKWIASQEKGVTVQAILQYTKWEITEGGATDNTIKKYIEDLDKAGIIEYKHPFWKITNFGRTWLERHSI
jgi:hypothetical protein